MSTNLVVKHQAHLWQVDTYLVSLVFRWVCAQSLSRVQLFAVPWTVARQAPLPMGFFQARILEWVTIPFFKGSSQPRDQARISCLLQWQAGSLPLAPPGKPLFRWERSQIAFKKKRQISSSKNSRFPLPFRWTALGLCRAIILFPFTFVSINQRIQVKCVFCIKNVMWSYTHCEHTNINMNIYLSVYTHWLSTPRVHSYNAFLFHF